MTRERQSNSIRVALVGYGAAARTFHEPVIDAVPGLDIVDIVAHRTDDPNRVFSNPGVDLVVITTPNASHADLVERALGAGKHVVVEKPFATTASDADRLVRMASDAERVLAVHHNRRWDGDFLTIRRLVDEGVLGDVATFESHFDRFRNEPKPNAWREEAVEGAGVLFDLGPHLVDQAIVLFGRPQAVTADVRRERSFALVDDAFTIELHYDLCTATLAASMLVADVGPRFRVHGSLGSFVKFGMDPQENALKAGRSPAEPSWGVEPPDAWGTLTTLGEQRTVTRVETVPGSYPSFYANVRDAIVDDANLDVKPEEAAFVIRVLEVARDSSATRRTISFEGLPEARDGLEDAG